MTQCLYVGEYLYTCSVITFRMIEFILFLTDEFILYIFISRKLLKQKFMLLIVLICFNNFEKSNFKVKQYNYEKKRNYMQKKILP